jgi:transposase
MELLNKDIRSGPIISIDETTVQEMKEVGRSNTTKSYRWVFRGGDPDKPLLSYQYHPTRSGKEIMGYIKGYKGYVQTDVYGGYDFLDTIADITHVGCWAHARRNFVDVVKASGKLDSVKGSTGVAEDAVSYIQRLYDIEKDAKERKLSFDKVYELRQEKSKPVLVEFKSWLVNNLTRVNPQGLLGKAISYTLNQWDRLIRYIDDGRIRIDNNLTENAIRTFVVGRKNWLFSGTPKGATASATLYSLIESARANSLEPYRYLRFLFEKIPFASTENDYKSLLPNRIDRSLLII